MAAAAAAVAESPVKPPAAPAKPKPSPLGKAKARVVPPRADDHVKTAAFEKIRTEIIESEALTGELFNVSFPPNTIGHNSATATAAAAGYAIGAGTAAMIAPVTVRGYDSEKGGRFMTLDAHNIGFMLPGQLLETVRAEASDYAVCEIAHASRHGGSLHVTRYNVMHLLEAAVGMPYDTAWATALATKTGEVLGRGHKWAKNVKLVVKLAEACGQRCHYVTAGVIHGMAVAMKSLKDNAQLEDYQQALLTMLRAMPKLREACAGAEDVAAAGDALDGAIKLAVTTLLHSSEEAEFVDGMTSDGMGFAHERLAAMFTSDPTAVFDATAAKIALALDLHADNTAARLRAIVMACDEEEALKKASDMDLVSVDGIFEMQDTFGPEHAGVLRKIMSLAMKQAKELQARLAAPAPAPAPAVVEVEDDITDMGMDMAELPSHAQQPDMPSEECEEVEEDEEDEDEDEDEE